MKRQFLFILLALLMLGAVLFIYVHTILLPIKVKEFIEVKAQDYLQRRITIGTIDFKPFQGFKLSQIKIYKDNGTELLFLAQEADFNVLIAPLFKQKALIIPSLYIKEPSFHLIRFADGSFNALNLLHDASARSRGNATRFLIGKIAIDNGTLDYSDQTQETIFFDTYQNIDLKAALSLDKSINFSLKADSEIKESSIELTGKYDLGRRSLSVQSRLNNFPLADYLTLYWHVPGVDIKALRLSSESLSFEQKGASFNVLGQLAASEAAIRYQDFEYQGPFDLEELKLQVRDGTVKLSGLFHADAQLISSDGSSRHEAKLKLAIRSFGYSDERYRAILDAELTELGSSTSRYSLRCDSLSAKEIDISSFNALAITADAARCDKTFLQLPDETTLDSTVSLTNLRYIRSDEKSLIDSALALSNARLRTSDGKSLATDLSSPALNVEITDGAFRSNAAMDLTNTTLALDDTRAFSGNPKLNLQLDYNAGSEVPMTFKAQAVLAGAQLKGFAPLDPIENIHGNISIENDKISSPAVEFKALNTDFRASGRVDSIKTRTGAISLSSQYIDLGLLAKLFPSAMEKYALNASGPAAIDLKFEGPLTSMSKDNITMDVRLKNATVDLIRLKARLENLSGLVNFKNDELSWNDLALNFKGEPIALSGLLKLTETPKLSTHIKTSNIDAHANVTFDEEIIFIDELKGRYALSTFDATGRVHHNGQADLSFKGGLNLEDAQWFPKPVADKFSLINPVGKLNFSANFSGNVNDWRTSAIRVDANADAMRLIGYPLQQVEISYRQANGRIGQFSLRSFVYKGPFTIDGEGDLADNQISFTSHTKLDQMDLIEYRKDKKTKNRLLSGKLDCAFTMRGLLLAPQTYRGLGKLQIREAYLGQLIPQISSAIFTDGVADFQISGGKVQTDNARIISESLDLQAKGWVDFNKRIDFELIPALKARASIDTGKTKIDPSVLLSKAVSIKMTGTLEHPVKQVNTSTAGVIKNTTGVIAEGIGNILEDLF